MPDTARSGGYYPPPSFYFKVEFSISKNGSDTSFQSVSGLSVEYELETVKEGGENRFEHKLPGRTRYTDLVLKRGLLTDSEVIKWCLDALQNRDIKPADVSVTLLNEKHEPLKAWNIVRAWPKKWTVADMNANENSVLVETLELSYRFFNLK